MEKKRVIALSPHVVEILFSLDVGDWIVATTEFADYPSEAKLIPRVGGYHDLQIEKILALKPDLVIAWEGGNQNALIEKMETLGLNVFSSNVKEIKEISNEIREIGKRLGIVDKAASLANQFESDLKNLRKLNSAKRPIRFFYQLWDEPLQTITQKAWVNESLSICAGENVFQGGKGSDYPLVSTENVLTKSPEVIFIPDHQNVYQSKEKWNNWPEIEAVANQHIFQVDGNLLHRASTRILDGVRSICAIFDRVRTSKNAN